MKRRLTLIYAVTFAAILIGSLAYATEKTKQAKPVDLRPVTISEEETLQAELLEAIEDTQKKLPRVGGTKKNVAEVVKAQVLAKRPEK